MNQLYWLNDDILNYITEFISNYADLLPLHQTCRYFYYYRFNNIICEIHHICANIGTITDITLDLNINDNIEALLNVNEVVKLTCLYDSRLISNYIVKFQNLTYLNCCLAEWVSDDAVLSLPHLTHLDCGCATRLSGYMLERMPNLTYLDCGDNTNFNDYSIKQLTNLTTLCCGFGSDISYRSIITLTKLTTLELDNKYMPPEFFTYLPNLTSLSVYDLNYTDELLQYIPNILILECNGKNFTKNRLSQLKKLKTLYDCSQIYNYFLNCTHRRYY